MGADPTSGNLFAILLVVLGVSLVGVVEPFVQMVLGCVDHFGGDLG